jgi:hypothetical protein
MPKDDRVYLGHMLEMARKARARVAGEPRADFDADEDLRFVIAHLTQTIGEAASQVSQQRGMRTPRSHGSRSPAFGTGSSTITWAWVTMFSDKWPLATCLR